jgi:POT family proton-dependent oligopeptide transporter
MASHLMLVIALALIWGVVVWMLAREFSAPQTEVPATWFGVLNSFFIVLLAPLFSRFWMKYWNPSGPVKFAAGLVLLGLGFGVLAYGANGIDPGAKAAKVSMLYLIVAYLLHTMGELCLSPVGLSYISKLAPKHLLSAMFGIWFLNAAVAAWIAGATGSYIDDISSVYSMSGFFLIFAVIPALAGLLLLAMSPWLKRKMHSVQ